MQIQLNDPRLLALLARVSVTPDGREVIAWLKSLHDQQLAEMRDMVDVGGFQRAQGAAQLLHELYEAIERAKAVADKTQRIGPAR